MNLLPKVKNILYLALLLEMLLEGQKGSEHVENGRDVEHSNPSAKNQLGYLVQEESGSDSK